MNSEFFSNKEKHFNRLNDEYKSMIDVYTSTMQHDFLNIFRKYCNDLYTIKSNTEEKLKILEENYKITVKQLHAIYDVYEVTISQIDAYKSCEINKLLVSNIDTITHLNSTLSTHKESQIINKDTCSSLELNIDIQFGALEDPILYPPPIMEEARNQGIGSDELIRFTAVTSDLMSDYIIKIDDFIIKNTKCMISNELDIIALWSSDYARMGSKTHTLFIKLSTGERICHNDSIPIGNAPICDRVMYCNNKIIRLWISSFRTYTINMLIYNSDYSSGDIHYAFNLPFVDVTNHKLLSLDNFYSDSRGLYVCYKNSIYFIGPIDYIINNKFIYKKIDIDLFDYYFHISKILSIDYTYFKMSVIQTYHGKCKNPEEKIKTMLTLSLSDIINII